MCMEASVDTALRVALAGLHILTMAGGFMTAIGLGWTTRIFGDKCLLYSDMDVSMSKNSSVTLGETEWGSLKACYYCTFSTGVASIYAIIWFWFYFLLSEWDRTNTLSFEWSLRIIKRADRDRPPPDARLLFPTLLFNVLLWICVVVSLGLITKGSNTWCKSIMDSLNQPCSYLSTVAWSNVQDGDSAYTYLRIAQAGNWILVFSILAKILIVGCRLYLYLKREAHSPRRPTRHHNSLATKYVSFTDEERRHLDSGDFGDLFQDIPYADSEDEIATCSGQNREIKELHADIQGEQMYHNQSFSSDDMETDKMLPKDGARKSRDQDEDHAVLLHSHEQSFKYNTL